MSSQCTFTSHVEILEKAMRWHVVFIPDKALLKLGIKGTTRLIGTMNGAAFNLAAMSNGEGQYYLVMGLPLRKAAKVKLGNAVKVIAERDPQPKQVTVPEELEAALDNDPKALEIFNGFTPGYRRSVVHYVNGAKRIDTRIKRALELCDKMRMGTLHGMKNKDG